MQIDVTRVGPDLESVTNQIVRNLTQAQRGIGRDVAKAGRKAILDDVRSRRGSLRFASGKLSVKTKTEATSNGVTVTLNGYSVGAWVIVESGAGSHEIEPRRGRRALKFDGLYSAHAAHPGARGTRAWSKAEPALDRAVTPEVENGVADAMEA